MKNTLSLTDKTLQRKWQMMTLKLRTCSDRHAGQLPEVSQLYWLGHSPTNYKSHQKQQPWNSAVIQMHSLVHLNSGVTFQSWKLKWQRDAVHPLCGSIKRIISGRSQLWTVNFIGPDRQTEGHTDNKGGVHTDRHRWFFCLKAYHYSRERHLHAQTEWQTNN